MSVQIEMPNQDNFPNDASSSIASSIAESLVLTPKNLVDMCSPELQEENCSSSVSNITIPLETKNPILVRNAVRLSYSPQQSKVPTPYGSTTNVNANGSYTELTPEEKGLLLRKNLTIMFSSIYSVLLVIIGGTIYIQFRGVQTGHIREIFTSFAAGLGLVWLLFLHVDLYRYKTMVLKMLKEYEESIQENADAESNHTNCTLDFYFKPDMESPSYRFLRGRHSGSFYLKAGMAAFCFGHLISEGFQLGQEILNYLDPNKKAENCSSISAAFVHIIVPLYSFYQLFIIFKYSNVVINRHKGMARFGLMHIIATCLCFWFNTIVEDALEDYHANHKVNDNGKRNESNDSAPESVMEFPTESHGGYCSDTILSVGSLRALPYLYPFTVEFNLLLAGVWFVVWQNIGREHTHSNPHHFHHKISNDGGGNEEIVYQSNLVINADCHASNKGLFAGLFLLLVAIITIIVFFVAINSEGYVYIGVILHTSQEGTLTIIALLGVIIAYFQLYKLDFNLHPITFLDDVLLFVPLPFFFINSFLSAMAEFDHGNVSRSLIPLLMTLQVILQTPFIIDGLRRCSNSQSLRYQKPGREVVTFLIILNLTMWIINTFELKSVEHYYAQKNFYGELLWMLVSHTTLPLMLFYRFHSSVCLADIWKSAYERGE